jgi:hypothetical protein
MFNYCRDGFELDQYLERSKYNSKKQMYAYKHSIIKFACARQFVAKCFALTFTCNRCLHLS